MTFTTRTSSADTTTSAFLPPSAPLTERQAQYLAWKERMMNRTRDGVIDLAEPAPTPSVWTVESLFADGTVVDEPSDAA